jgi:hypothetical protein
VRSSRVEDQSEQVGRNLCTTAAGEPCQASLEMDALDPNREKRPPNILMYNLYCFPGTSISHWSRTVDALHISLCQSRNKVGVVLEIASRGRKINSNKIVITTGNGYNTDVTGEPSMSQWVDVSMC